MSERTTAKRRAALMGWTEERRQQARATALAQRAAERAACWSKSPCLLCGQEDWEPRMEYAPRTDAFVHRACMTDALNTQAFSKQLLGLAREVGMSRGCAGRKGWECRQGHPFTPENTGMKKNGQGVRWQYCRTCAREYHRRHPWATRPYALHYKRAQSERTHCKNGHPFTPETVVPIRGGGRLCRVCLTEAAKKGVEARWKRLRDPETAFGREVDHWLGPLGNRRQNGL